MKEHWSPLTIIRDIDVFNHLLSSYVHYHIIDVYVCVSVNCVCIIWVCARVHD